MTNKGRFKKAVCVVLAAFGVLYLVNSCRPVDSHAYDLPTGTSLVSGDTLHNLLGNTLTAQYLDSDLQYKSTTATFYRVESGVQVYDTTVSSSAANGRSIVWYQVEVPVNSLTSSPISPHVIVDFNLHFENVSYADFGYLSYVSNSFLNLSASSVRPYSYLSYNFGNTNNYLYASSDSSGEHLGTFSVIDNFPPIHYYNGNFYQIQGNSDLYIGSVSGACLRPYSGTLVLVGITDIILNSDYVYGGLTPPPSSPVSGGVGVSSGSLSGTVGDSPIDITVEVEQEFPEYFYSGGDAPVYDDEGYAQELAPVIDEADNAYEVVEDGLEVLSEMPMLPSWNFLDSILSLVPAFKALMIAAFILTLYGWKIYR